MHEVVNSLNNKCTTLTDDESYDQNISSNQYFTVNTFNEDLGSLKKYNSIIHFNCRSLSNFFFEKLELFRNDLEHQFDIIGLSDTWLSDSSPLSMFHKIINLKAIIELGFFKGGGTGMYIHKSVQYKLRIDLARQYRNF